MNHRDSTSYSVWFIFVFFSFLIGLSTAYLKMSLDLRNVNRLLIIVIWVWKSFSKSQLWLALPILFFLFFSFYALSYITFEDFFIYLFVSCQRKIVYYIFNLKTFPSSIILDCLRTHVQIHHIEVELHQYPRQIHFICR